MKFVALAVCALLPATVALGQGTGTQAGGAPSTGAMTLGPATGGPIDLLFDAYAAGLNVIKMSVTVEMTDRGYHLDVNYRTAGMFGVLVHNQVDTWATGNFTAAGVEPLRFYSYGTLRGTPRRTQIDYPDGQPEIRILEPPAGEDRDPVPPELQRNTVDTLSAMILLVRELERTGECNGHVATFDGRRSSEISVRDAGTAIVPKHGDSLFSGPAHECEFEGRQTGGFVKDVSRAVLERPQRGIAWLAPIFPDAPPMPVRLSFHTRFFGDAILYLTAMKRGGEPYTP